jgi:hypothetical protein
VAHITKDYTSETFGPNPTLDQKIEIFRSRVFGWQIDIAEELERLIGTVPEKNPLRHAGYALVSILFSYFEMIAQFEGGADSTAQSRSFFERGFRSVFAYPPECALTSDVIREIYVRVRCGMYHDAWTKHGVFINGSYPFTFRFNGSLVEMNPHRLVRDIKEHFHWYIRNLRDPANTVLRSNFLARFDHGIAFEPGPWESTLLTSGSGHNAGSGG